ncbi:MAG: LCP family protein [Actinomycetota bacterium]|nr:LCP family protein [Actinomycetota bacterium]
MQSPAQRGRYGERASRERVPRTDYQPRVDLEAARRARLEMDRMAGHAVPSDAESYWDAGQDSKPRGFRLSFGRKKDKEKKAASRDRRRVKHPVLAVIAILLVVVGAWMLVLDHNMHIDDDDLDMACEGHAWPFKPYYVLITGADAEDEGAQRTDSIMLARIDPLRKRATLVSVPRDTRVDLGGYGQSKINAAYSYGGPALATRTVADFASVGDVDVDIAHFFQVGFDGLADLVDAVGGVTVDVPPNTTVDGVTVPAGVQTLDGEQALIFVRCRKTYANGDFQRAQNQRVLMGALADKVKHSPPWRWPGIITAASKCIKSDAHAWQFFGVLLEVAGTGSDDIYSAQVPSRTKTIGGVSYVITDEEAWAQMMENVDAGKDPEATTTS